jgi:SAM-dependent methyltransferase
MFGATEASSRDSGASGHRVILGTERCTFVVVAVHASGQAGEVSVSAGLGAGRCDVCGHVGEFVLTDAPTRENHQCRSCDASLRYRAQAAALSAAYGCPGITLAELIETPSFPELEIYEPGISGPLRCVLRRLPHYADSYFWPHVAPGEAHEGVRCEDLRRLTFPDQAFDLVISSDILEHVRGPMEAFAEIFRVLRPGGRHVFTVPLAWPLPSTTQARVDYSGPKDVFLMPPEYHGSPVDPKGSLVYTDFGMDLPESLRELGFETLTHHGYRNAITFISRKPSAREG